MAFILNYCQFVRFFSTKNKKKLIKSNGEKYPRTWNINKPETKFLQKVWLLNENYENENLIDLLRESWV